MKQSLLVALVCLTSLGYAQSTEEEAVKMAIDNFFIGFHQKDRTKMQDAVTEGVVMQTVAKNKEGKTIVKTEIYDEFVNSIMKIPVEASFEEKLLSYAIQIDGNMAHVWAPYGFWYNNEFSHCGVNSIQMVKIDDEWKIVYLIDTRRKENCILE